MERVTRKGPSYDLQVYLASRAERWAWMACHVPCVTFSDNTEWTKTPDIRANRLAGCDHARTIEAAQPAMNAGGRWDVRFGAGNNGKHVSEMLLDVTSRYGTALRCGHMRWAIRWHGWRGKDGLLYGGSGSVRGRLSTIP